MIVTMVQITFENISFVEREDAVRVYFLKNFYFDIPVKDLDSIAKYTVHTNGIEFVGISEKKAHNKFNTVLTKGFRRLQNSMNARDTVYVHTNSGIPLIGSRYFGIVDKGSEMVEVKPITGCDLNCIFCSVNEGISSKKTVDFVVEKDYIVEELNRLVAYKDSKVDVYINPQGEPLLYGDLIPLIHDIRKIKHINTISIITNACTLTKEYADSLIDAGLNQINISINSLDEKNARKMAGIKQYDIKKVIAIIKHIKDKITVVLSPVLMNGINHADVEDLIVFAKKNKLKIFIQNFQTNKHGRNPVKQFAWKEFYAKMKAYEEKYHVTLIDTEYEPRKTKEYPAPYSKGDTVKLTIIAPGRYYNERIGALKGRCITIKGCNKPIGTKVSVEITRSKNNIYFAR